jgi:hypothetical protein
MRPRPRGAIRRRPDDIRAGQPYVKHAGVTAITRLSSYRLQYLRLHRLGGILCFEILPRDQALYREPHWTIFSRDLVSAWHFSAQPLPFPHSPQG